MKRKEFLAAAAIGTTSLVAGLPLLTGCSSKKGKDNKRSKIGTNEELGLPPLLETAPDGKPLKVGLIGCGGRGTGAALNLLSAGNGLSIVALADVLPDKLEEGRKILNEHKQDIPDERAFLGFDAYKKVLDTDIDAVIIALPSRFHPMMFAAAVEAGKHVFIEKPCGVDPVGVRSFIATAKRAQDKNLSVVCGTQRRHGMEYCETYKRVASGLIGDIVGGSCYWMTGRTWYTNRRPGWTDTEYIIRNWLNYPFMGGDVIVDHHIHNLDVVSWFMGNQVPVKAYGFGAKVRPSLGNKYDFFSIDYEFANGAHIASGTRHIDQCSDLIGEFVMGTKGKTNCCDTIWDHEGNVLWKYPHEEFPVRNHYVQEHIDWVTSIRTNNPLNEAFNMARSTLIAIMGRDSAYTGLTVTWDEIMASTEKLGPEMDAMGKLDYSDIAPLPGAASHFG